MIKDINLRARIKSWSLLFLIVLACASRVASQSDNAYQQIKYHDGSILTGKIIDSDEKNILFKLFETTDTLLIKRHEIKRIKQIDNRFHKYSVHENIGISQSAFNLKKGEKKIGTVDFFYYEFSIGISNKFSLSVGGLSDGSIAGVLIPKYTHSLSDRIHLGLIAAIGYDSYLEDIVLFPGGVLSYGTPNKFINLTYHRVAGLDKAYNSVSLGGSINITNEIAITTDHILPFNNKEFTEKNKMDFRPSHSFLLRFSIKSKHLIQLGYYRLNATNVIESLPILAYSYSWGLKKNKWK